MSKNNHQEQYQFWIVDREEKFREKLKGLPHKDSHSISAVAYESYTRSIVRYLVKDLTDGNTLENATSEFDQTIEAYLQGFKKFADEIQTKTEYVMETLPTAKESQTYMAEMVLQDSGAYIPNRLRFIHLFLILKDAKQLAIIRDYLFSDLETILLKKSSGIRYYKAILDVLLSDDTEYLKYYLKKDARTKFKFYPLAGQALLALHEGRSDIKDLLEELFDKYKNYHRKMIEFDFPVIPLAVASYGLKTGKLKMDQLPESYQEFKDILQIEQK